MSALTIADLEEESDVSERCKSTDRTKKKQRQNISKI